MTPLENLYFAELVLMRGPQTTSSWAGIEFIRKAMQQLQAAEKRPIEQPQKE